MKKLVKTGAFAVMATLVFSSTAFAGTWRQTDGKWWYDFNNGSYAANGWQWIDGNNDGAAESYYFDRAGWLLTSTTTPDGYTVNADGAWTENGVIQTKNVEAQQAQLQTQETTSTQAASDFAGYSGTYQVTNAMFLEFIGLDNSWANVTVVVSGTAGNLSATVNGMAATDVRFADGMVQFTVPNTECEASISNDGAMVFLHQAIGDSAEYRKVN